MPLLHISLRAGKPEAYRQAICDNLYRAMRDTLAVPEDDQFMIVTEHDAANFRYGNAYGVTRSDDLVYIQIIVFDTRTRQQKRRCSGGSRSCSVKIPASARKTCS
jgi:4-oxalocrotonate tautomerase